MKFSSNEIVLYDGKFLSLRSKNTWEYVTRRGATGVVGILAVTADKKLLLVEQFRPAVGRKVIELPAGLAGDLAEARDEDFSTAAGRELLEETGYEAANFRLLTVGPSSAGLTDETIWLYLASNLKKAGAGGGDESEDIAVHEVSLTDAKGWLAARVRSGELIDFKVFAGLWFLEHADFKP
jgi:ADP-ribose pyrophosphatase